MTFISEITSRHTEAIVFPHLQRGTRGDVLPTRQTTRTNTPSPSEVCGAAQRTRLYYICCVHSVKPHIYVAFIIIYYIVMVRSVHATSVDLFLLCMLTLLH